MRKFRANPDFLLREVAGEAVLIPIGEAGVFENSVISLNDTCSFLWKLFQTPKTAEDVIAEAKKEYSDPDGTMEQGIYSFISDYLRYGLLLEEE
ncbi:PqqD family protein [Mediterraneibacter glycyrrhizinilyticus]|uniref:PqqD family protein n=1 Tax=Mediterraneibacter glycyrrhizinilyticus TaxID=342942 RepID=UPI0025AAC814|nr:PqqD family protein [Mediterraneibacter glycyrrhizinilyticus]MDN0044587.1 PqqD family protein [Mediterraneibacter glycyrrhizinilyticus]